MNAPTLWSCIVPGNSSFVSVALQRAGSAPLRLQWNSHRSSKLSFSDIQPHMSRIHAMHLTVQSNIWNPRRDFFEDKSFPSLESLVLTSANVSNAFVNFESFEKHSYQALRVFRLDGVVPERWFFNPASFRNLHTLHLRVKEQFDPDDEEVDDGDDGLPDPPSMNEFLDVIESCYRLQDLLLVRAGPILRLLQSPISAPQRIVTLPHLQSLVLASRYGTSIAAFLAHLAIPTTAHVHLHQIAILGFDHMDSLNDCFPVDLSRLGFLQAMSTIDVTYRGYGQRITGFHGRATKFQPCLEIMLSDVSKLTFMQMGRLFSQSIVTTLSLTGVIDISFNVTQSDWNHILSSFHSLVTLTLRSKDVLCIACGFDVKLRAFLRALTVPPTVIFFMLPCLTSLSIHPIRHSLVREVERDLWLCADSRRCRMEDPSSFQLFINGVQWRVS